MGMQNYCQFCTFAKPRLQDKELNQKTTSDSLHHTLNKVSVTVSSSLDTGLLHHFYFHLRRLYG